MYITTNDIRTCYRLSGIEDGDTVMLSHSLASSQIMWQPQMALLEARYRVLRYDTRGHGDSDAPASAYSLDQLGDDVCALLDALEIDRVHFIGLSLGGMVAQNLALRFPRRLASISLCDTMAAIPPETLPVWQERIDLAAAHGMEPHVEPTIERWFTAPYRAENPPAIDAIRKQIAATPTAGYIGCCHAIRELNYLDRLSQIGLPTQIIVGEDDPGTPVEASRAMHEAIPGSSLTIIPEAAHLSNIEQAALFNQALLEFLR